MILAKRINGDTAESVEVNIQIFGGIGTWKMLSILYVRRWVRQKKYVQQEHVLFISLAQEFTILVYTLLKEAVSIYRFRNYFDCFGMDINTK